MNRTKHNILYRDKLRKDAENIPKGGRPLNWGEVKPYKSIMGGVLMNLVNYGGGYQ